MKVPPKLQTKMLFGRGWVGGGGEAKGGALTP